MLVRPLITPPLRQTFSTDTNIKPEDTFDGKIIIVDLPVQEFRLVGRIASLAWKYCFQIAVLRRCRPPTGKVSCARFFCGRTRRKISCRNLIPNTKPLPVPPPVAPSISRRTARAIRRVLKNNDAVDSLLATCRQNSFAKIRARRTNGRPNFWANAGCISPAPMSASPRMNTCSKPRAKRGQAFQRVSRAAQQRRFFVEPARFTTLKRGGALNNFQVEAIVYNGGNLFHDGREPLPYKFITFNQK